MYLTTLCRIRYKFACIFFIHRKMQNDQIVIYKTENDETVIDVKLENDTIWLTQKLMSEFFEKDSDTIGLHIKNI